MDNVEYYFLIIVLCQHISHWLYSEYTGQYTFDRSAMYFHHIITILMCSVGLYQGRYVNFLVYGLFFAELSAPLSHFKEFLKDFNLRYTLAYEVMEMLYFATYIIGRVMMAGPKAFEYC